MFDQFSVSICEMCEIKLTTKSNFILQINLTYSASISTSHCGAPWHFLGTQCSLHFSQLQSWLWFINGKRHRTCVGTPGVSSIRPCSGSFLLQFYNVFYLSEWQNVAMKLSFLQTLTSSCEHNRQMLDLPWHLTSGSPQNSSLHSPHVLPPKPGWQEHWPLICGHNTHFIFRHRANNFHI